MKILFAADGSRFTKKALAFLVNHDNLAGAPHELHVLNVQLAVPPRAQKVAGSEMVQVYYEKEAESVLKPIRKFLERHNTDFHADWVIGSPAAEIIKAAHKDKAHLIVMGTHGHGMLGRMLLGSVAQRVVADGDTPILLVK
jgi:nucleotide-binding universal stress UspA family protein